VLYTYKGTMPANTIINNIRADTIAIADCAFLNCTGLTSITIPTGLTTIGIGAFKKASELTTITIPNSVTSIGSSAFHDTAWFNKQPDGLVYAGKVLYRYKGTMPANTIINTIRADTIAIADYAFFDCTGLASVTIPASVTSIGEAAFSGRDGLQTITFAVGSKLQSIGNGAFDGCRGLTSIVIPNSVTSIGDRAFFGCENLTSINIPNSVTSIGDRAFFGCENLTSINIPNSITSIGDRAFFGCENLTSVIFEARSDIASTNFGTYNLEADEVDRFAGNNLRTAYLAGGAGRYTRDPDGRRWTKQR